MAREGGIKNLEIFLSAHASIKELKELIKENFKIDDEIMMYTQSKNKIDKKCKPNDLASSFNHVSDTIIAIAYNTKDILKDEAMKSSDIYLINLSFNRVVRKFILMTGDEEVCTNTMLLIHKDDTEREINK